MAGVVGRQSRLQITVVSLQLIGQVFHTSADIVGRGQVRREILGVKLTVAIATAGGIQGVRPKTAFYLDQAKPDRRVDLASLAGLQQGGHFLIGQGDIPNGAGFSHLLRMGDFYHIQQGNRCNGGNI